MNISDWDRFLTDTEQDKGCLIWTGMKDSSGYGEFAIGNKIIGSHKAAYEHVNGFLPSGVELDHYLCYRHDCVTAEHLVPVTHSQNMQNRKGAASHSQSGVRGVMWEERRKKFRVQVRVEGKTRTRYVPTLEEAIVAQKTLFADMTTHPMLGGQRA